MVRTSRPPQHLPAHDEHATSLTDARLRRIVEVWRDPGLERHGLHLSVMEFADRRVEELTCEVSVWPEAHERAQHEAEKWARLRHVGLCLLHMPWLDRLFCTERLSWEQVDVLSRVISPPHEDAWIDQALALDLGSLTALVERSARGGPPNTAGAPVARPDRLELEACEEGTSLELARRDLECRAPGGVRRALVREQIETVDAPIRATCAHDTPTMDLGSLAWAPPMARTAPSDLAERRRAAASVRRKRIVSLSTA